jgi:hypothetical protein
VQTIVSRIDAASLFLRANVAQDRDSDNQPRSKIVLCIVPHPNASLMQGRLIPVSPARGEHTRESDEYYYILSRLH